MLELNKKYAKVKDKITSKTERLKRKIERTDGEIDDLVYKLYGLTEEEIGGGQVRGHENDEDYILKLCKEIERIEVK